MNPAAPLMRSSRALTRTSFTPQRSILFRSTPTTRSFHRATRVPAITSSQARRRPTLNAECQTVATFPAQVPQAARTIFIQTQDTPNADALKFIPNHPVLPPNFPLGSLEYTSPRSTLAPPHPSPLAARLLNVDGVSSIFYGADFITVNKVADTNWAHIKPEVFSLITEAVSSGEQIVATTARTDASGPPETEDSLLIKDDDDEVVAMIKELLETRVRPAIQDDGGDLEYRGFNDGIVMLKLRGACRTCDSSTVTLKNGIESMLMHYIEEVKGIEQVLDEEEEIAIQEFAKFEEKLKQQKGAAPPSTSGKDSLDYAA
ncbi:hypothetical protein PMZ80_007181 [Knufia obscura]|uniref:Scaffold protein Nfu/NifU N-terminal domain-containing protein n=1 Tax=Knufia obscura TaxID=1635080 RepID=A0ABR0RKX5_9EURO|nr:hypothetical protein PMZ80_007181 [Knufia obscura]